MWWPLIAAFESPDEIEIGFIGDWNAENFVPRATVTVTQCILCVDFKF
jgi:hypothetical protein